MNTNKIKNNITRKEETKMYYIEDIEDEIIDAIIEKEELEEYKRYLELSQALENGKVIVIKEDAEDEDEETAELKREIFSEKYPDDQYYHEEAIKRIQYLKEKFEK